jgi:formylglycine-generating enzyme required for sulfatase activity
MSQFNQKLELARRRQKRFYLIAGITVPVILLLVVALIVVSRGTRVDIIPEDAKEHAEIRVTKGLGFCVSDTVYSLAGNLVITASAPGFKAAVKEIDYAHLGKVIPLELFELPGRLIIEISGDDAQQAKTAWRINGREAALADKLDLELEAGRYTVTIDNPFFQPKEIEVEIKRREQTLLEIELLPVEGELNISSKPSGATVFLDEEKVGVTPLQLARDGGRYSLRVAADNYVDTVEQLAITRADPKVDRKYQLELKKAKVHLELRPRGGTLLVDGIQVAEDQLFLDATVEHRLTYMKAGYYPATKTVLLAADEEKQLSFDLQEETGKVEISSSPAATVLIGGKDHGESPVSIDLPAVAHEITLRKPGYRSVSKTVKPQGAKVQKVSVTLLTEYQARLQEAPREYTNQAGIKLKLFAIQDEFIMGAPRSEKGQRANEFQRMIRLTKPFYAGLFEISNSQFGQFNRQKAAGTDSTPVTSVSWQEAAAFCNWLSAKEKLRHFYNVANGQVSGFDTNSDGYRLLTEAEWEWLARKSGKPKQTIFTWGDETVIPPKVTNVADESAKGQVKYYVPNYNDGFPAVAPAGSFNRELSGLYDMAGNVSEWVHDVYSIVPPPVGTILSNPLGQQHGDAHVVKGANWRSGTITTLRPAFREGLTAGRDDVGFRIGRYLYGGEK